ncbi:MAG: NTP transferase domain-containing protein [Proteobacteria bacterium]|nr:NTP transferase domain-containing protein [Pseudomonadota bacterium]
MTAADAAPAAAAALAAGLSLGLLAGGRATRLGGADKAWAIFAGQSLFARTVAALAPQHAFAARMVSANRDLQRYASHDFVAIADRRADFPGPLAGIEAMLAVCQTAQLLTLPIDLRTIPSDLVTRLLAAGEGGAVACDASGAQPLVAIWPVERARPVVADALARGQGAVHRVVAALGLAVVPFAGTVFGNLNTPEDLQA